MTILSKIKTEMILFSIDNVKENDEVKNLFATLPIDIIKELLLTFYCAVDYHKDLLTDKEIFKKYKHERQCQEPIFSDIVPYFEFIWLINLNPRQNKASIKEVRILKEKDFVGIVSHPPTELKNLFDFDIHKQKLQAVGQILNVGTNKKYQVFVFRSYDKKYTAGKVYTVDFTELYEWFDWESDKKYFTETAFQKEISDWETNEKKKFRKRQFTNGNELFETLISTSNKKRKHTVVAKKQAKPKKKSKKS